MLPPLGLTIDRSLTLQTTISALPDWFVNVVTEKTEKLKYDDCKGLSNILMEYDHGRLHGLKHLKVSGSHDIFTELMNTTTRVPKGPVFQTLEELHVDSVDCLKELCVGELPPGSLCNLKVLKVCNCSYVGDVLLPSKLLQRLPNLEELTCSKMDRMEYVFGCDGFEPEQSKLRVMRLEYLDAVRSICNGPVPRTMFQTLKSLAISDCELLQSVFTYDAAQCLFQLEELFVGRSPSLERVIETSKETMNNKKIDHIQEGPYIIYFVPPAR